MTEKRFTVHIVFSNLEKTEGEIELKDNGQPLLISESIDDVRYLKDLLNELHEENQQLKSDLARVIEQARKNNELCVSDIRILEKALWCSGCENDYNRLRQLKKEFLK